MRAKDIATQAQEIATRLTNELERTERAKQAVVVHGPPPTAKGDPEGRELALLAHMVSQLAEEVTQLQQRA